MTQAINLTGIINWIYFNQMIEKENNSKHNFFLKKSNYDNLKKKKTLEG